MQDGELLHTLIPHCESLVQAVQIGFKSSSNSSDESPEFPANTSFISARLSLPCTLARLILFASMVFNIY